MQKAIIDEHPGAEIDISIIWIDKGVIDNRLTAARSSRMFHDVRLAQFHDPQQRLGFEIGRSLGHPELAAWDIYLFYDEHAIWSDSLPPSPRWFVQMDPEDWNEIQDTTFKATGGLACGGEEITAVLRAVMDTLHYATP